MSKDDKPHDLRQLELGDDRGVLGSPGSVGDCG